MVKISTIGTIEEKSIKAGQKKVRKTSKKEAKTAEVSVRNWVAESNTLIEMPYRLDLNEQKLVLTLASKVHPEDTEFQYYSFKISELANLFGIAVTGAYTEIRNCIEGVMSKPIRIVKTTPRGRKRELIINWFASAEYIEEEGRIELEFSDKMKPFLLQLKEKYTSFQLGSVMDMKSVYAIRIYMICQEILMNRSEAEKPFYIDYLKEIFQIQNKYEKFVDFKRFVLEQSRKEINLKSDIEFDYDFIKESRKVVAILFKARRKKASIPKQLPEIQPNGRDEIIQQLLDMGVDAMIIPDLIADKDDEFIIENIELVKKRYSSGKVNTNLAGYLVKALKNDYRPKKSPMEISQEEERIKEKEKNEEEVKAILDRYEEEKKEILEKDGEKELDGHSKGQGSLFDFMNEANQEIAVGQARKIESSKLEIEKELDRLMSAIKERTEEGWPREEIEVLKNGQLDIIKRRYPDLANEITILWGKRLGEVG